MAGDITGRTNLSSLSLGGGLDIGTDSGTSLSLTSNGRLALASGTSLVVASGATVTWLPGAMWSMGTISTAASLSSLAGTGFQLGIFFGASGCSLIGRSGNTIYTIGASAVSAAAP